MKFDNLIPLIPFIWPEARVLEGLSVYQHGVPFHELVIQSKGIFGVVSCIDEQGINWLKHIIENREDVNIKLVLALYGACGTESKHLEQLLKIQRQYPSRIEISIYTTEISYKCGTPTNLLCCLGDGGHFVQIGPATNFGLSGTMDAQVSLVFKAEASLMNEIRKWFDYLWHRSSPLTENTTCIPSLVPARGNDEAEEMWHLYLEECEKAKGVGETRNLQITVDPETGEVTATDKEGNVVKPPTEALNLKPLDGVGVRISELYQQGHMVTIDKATRIPPLEAPIKAEWFGMETLRQIGAITRQIQYKITLFDDKTMKDIDSKRKALRPLINAFSFPISDGVAWMPAKAMGLFEEQVKSASEDGKIVLLGVVGTDKDRFVEDRMNKITVNANDMYREATRSNGNLPDDVIKDIAKDLKLRLGKAFTGNFLPQVTYTSVNFIVNQESEVTSPWGQALSLLEKIACLPREIYSDPYKMRGIRLSQNDYANAMNVLDDALLQKLPDVEPSQRECKTQLALIDEMMNLDVLEHKQKCFLLLAIIDGMPKEAFDKMLADFVVEAHTNAQETQDAAS